VVLLFRERKTLPNRRLKLVSERSAMSNHYHNVKNIFKKYRRFAPDKKTIGIFPKHLKQFPTIGIKNHRIFFQSKKTIGIIPIVPVVSIGRILPWNEHRVHQK